MSAFTPRPAAEVDHTLADVEPATSTQAEPPWWQPLRSTFTFLLVPALIVFVPRLFGTTLPVPLLYVLAAVCGAIMAVRALSNPELLLATFILYLPFSRTYAAAIAPGINGTNVLYALILVAWIASAVRNKRPFLMAMPFSRLVSIWAVLSVLSVFTAMTMMGVSYITDDRLPQVKAWCDQFFVFFAVLNLIRNGAAARRMAVYMMLGMLLVLISGFMEWQDKRYFDRIDKARLLGPQQQPNDFGAFIVYGFGIPGALVLCYMWRLRTWLLATPVLYMAARVLLATFSRGAVLGMGALVAALLLVRGRVLAASISIAAALVVQVAPEILPASLSARMSQTTSETDGELDKSSQTRLILWDAAMRITLDYPIFGTGFATFPKIKDQYASMPTVESDNHNMFLFICSQMGIPALAVFLLIFIRMAYIGARVHKHESEPFGKVIGLGAVGTAAGVLAVNMFGSRMTDAEVMAYVWITIAVLSHLWRELEARRAVPAAPPDHMTR
jgi:hypothetical protein